MPENNQAGAVSRALLPHRPNAVFVRWGTFLAGGLIVLAALAAYHNSFSGPFILDDNLAITANPSIKHFGSALSPPATSTACGRPLLSLSFALNYALGGMNVWGYHAFNLLVHTLAGLTLFGLVRRTLVRPTLSERFGANAAPLALAVAVIWTVHPLQTETVTYISQRAELLMGLFYLLTLYCFIRSQESGDRSQEMQSGFRPLTSGLWMLASIFSCLLGVMSKEVIGTAPIVVLLYDRTFVAGSFREAWRLRRRYYLGLACTWLPLAGLMTSLGKRGVGFDLMVSWWSYALTSCRSVVLYLKLAVWPHPLVFDYGTQTVQHATDVIPYALVLALLLLATLLALWYRPVIGFAEAWFFIILAPASSVIPVVGQPMAEHRMYLPLAGIITLGVLGLHGLIGRHSVVACFALALGLILLTVQRNNDYQSALALWGNTAANCPDNMRARFNFGNALASIPNRRGEAIAEYEGLLRIDPGYLDARVNLAYILSEIPGRWPEAIAQYEIVLRNAPNHATAHNNLANILLNIPGRLPDAIAQYEAALQIKPDFVEARLNLGNAFASIPGRLPDAIAQYEAALRIKPDFKEAWQMLEAAKKAQAKNDRDRLK